MRRLLTFFPEDVDDMSDPEMSHLEISIHDVWHLHILDTYVPLPGLVEPERFGTGRYGHGQFAPGHIGPVRIARRWHWSETVGAETSGSEQSQQKTERHSKNRKRGLVKTKKIQFCHIVYATVDGKCKKKKKSCVDLKVSTQNVFFSLFFFTFFHWDWDRQRI